MFMVSNSIQAAVQAIVFLLLLYVAYSYFASKTEHARLFGLGIVFLSLSYASWAAATLLWTNPFIEYKTLAYTLQIASILVFLGCSVYLAPKKYQRALDIFVVVLAALIATYLFINPILDGSFVYSLRYYLSFQNEPTITIFSVIMALSLIFASFAIGSEKSGRFKLDLKRALFIVLAISLAISYSSYSDSVRLINTVVLLVDCTLLTFSHINVSISKK